jgi:hypothetical protein
VAVSLGVSVDALSHSPRTEKCNSLMRTPPLGREAARAGFLDLAFPNATDWSRKFLLVFRGLSSLRRILIRGIPFRAFLVRLKLRQSSTNRGYSGGDSCFLSCSFDLWKERLFCFCGPLCLSFSLSLICFERASMKILPSCALLFFS